MHFSPLGDAAIHIALGDSIDEATHRRVRAAVAQIDAARLAGVIDQVPAFASITVHYDPLVVAERASGASSYHQIVHELRALLGAVSSHVLPPPRVVEIPVCYGGDLGPDLEEVAERHTMSPADVIALHTAGDYLVYMVGFMPGFAYLGGLSERIATPRRHSPRTAVPAGAVGIGGSQTGVYPMVSPGGWNLIGQTPVRIFDIAREPATLLVTGDRVRFRAITRAQYEQRRDEQLA